MPCSVHVSVALLLAAGSCWGFPGRVPRVYNALITSNQNLSPSKAYPVYQPVLEPAFPFPVNPFFYHDGFKNLPGPLPLRPDAPLPPSVPKLGGDAGTTEKNASEGSNDAKPDEKPDSPATSDPKPSEGELPQPGLPPPPSTQSPIPLNEFGLPPAVLPINRLDNVYTGFNQVLPYYPSIPQYPNIPSYGLYDPFSEYLFPNIQFPLFRYPASFPTGFGEPQPPPTNSIGPNPQETTAKANADEPLTQPQPEAPSNIDVTNFPNKDPSIPNVPPPPLPKGGLKTNESNEQ